MNQYMRVSTITHDSSASGMQLPTCGEQYMGFIKAVTYHPPILIYTYLCVIDLRIRAHQGEGAWKFWSGNVCVFLLISWTHWGFGGFFTLFLVLNLLRFVSLLGFATVLKFQCNTMRVIMRPNAAILRLCGVRT